MKGRREVRIGIKTGDKQSVAYVGREKFKAQQGFGLVEVVVALGVLGIILAPMGILIGSLLKSTIAQENRLSGSGVAMAQNSCLRQNSTYPNGSGGTPTFPSLAIGGSSVQSSTSTATFTTQPLQQSGAPSGCNSSGTDVAGKTTYNISTKTSLLVDDHGSNSIGSAGAYTGYTNVENQGYGFSGSPQLLLQAESTVTWKTTGQKTLSTAQSTLLIPPQIDVLVTSGSSTPIPDATVTISGPGTAGSAPTSASTGTNGYVSFVNYAPGAYTVTAQPGSSSSQAMQTVTVSPNHLIATVKLGIPSGCTNNCTTNPKSPPYISSIQAPPWAQGENPRPTSVQGPWAGGNQVVLCGTNFTGADSVSFDNTTSNPNIVSSAQFYVASGTGSVTLTVNGQPDTVSCGNSGHQIIVATVPASTYSGGASTANVTVSNTAGQSNAVQYQYITSPIITSMTVVGGTETEPNATENPIGTPFGGTQLVLNGFNFTGATHVDFCIYLSAYIGKYHLTAPCSTQRFSATSATEGSGPVNVNFTVVSDSEIKTASPLDLVCPSGWDAYDCAYMALELATDGSMNNYAAVWVSNLTTANGQTYAQRSDPYQSNECQDAGIYPESAVTVQSTGGNQQLYCHFQYVFPPSISYMNKQTGTDLVGLPTYVPTNGGTTTGGNTVYLCPGNNLFHNNWPGKITGVVLSGPFGTSGSQATESVPSSDWSSIQQGITLDGPCGATAFGYGYINLTMPPSPFPNQGAGTVCVQAEDAVQQLSQCLNDNNPYTSGTYYTYVHVPQITSISPSGGPVGGGNTVTISGQYLNGVSTVNFACLTGSNISINSAGTSLTVTVPNAPSYPLGICANPTVLYPDGPEQVTVTVTNPAGTSNGLTYTYANTPSISSLNPGNGPASGGNTIDICGSNLQYITSASFGGSTTSNVSEQSWGANLFNGGPCSGAPTGGYNYLSVVVPSSPNGGYDQVGVTITNSAGMTSNSATYTYNPPAPTISSISQHGGGETGGYTIYIYGSNLDGPGFNTSVKFGCAGNASINWGNSGELSVNVPDTTSADGNPCNYFSIYGTPPFQTNITVSTIGGSGSWGPWTYQNSASISSLSPSVGSEWGGTWVCINGSNLQYATYVVFNGNWINVRYNGNNGQVCVSSPSNNGNYGTANVQVIMPSGVGNSGTLTYTYEGPPSISSISPTNFGYCITHSNFNFTIYGNNFTGTSSVSIGGSTYGVSYSVNNNGKISVTIQWYATPSGTVQVNTPLGSATGASISYHSTCWSW